MKKKVRLNFESDDSELELPRNEKRVVDCTIKDNEWLKMFR
jgi:hypothetical protein